MYVPQHYLHSSQGEIMSNMHTYNYVDIMIKETTKATEISQLPFVKMLYVMFVV